MALTGFSKYFCIVTFFPSALDFEEAIDNAVPKTYSELQLECEFLEKNF